MRAITTFFTVLFCAVFLFGQNWIPPQQNYNLQSQFSEQVCPYDSFNLVILPNQWSVYQTLDGSWNGTQDSSRCLSFWEMDGDWILDLETLNPALPLFFRYKAEGLDIELPTNGFYRNTGSYWTDATVSLADTCTDELCSGLLAVYTVPFSADSTVERIIREVAGEYKEVSGCWPTENLDSIYLQEYVMKFTFEEEDLTGLTFKPQLFYSEELEQGSFGGYSPVFGFEFYEYMASDETTYRGFLEETAIALEEYPAYYYVQQDASLGFPSFDHYTYVEAFPNFATDTVLDLIVYFATEDELNFQPFTGVRGALLPGSDTLRHNLTLEYDYPNICQLIIVDIIVPDNTTYLMGSGIFDFANQRSCFMFETGGTLAIKEDAIFEYGQAGIGVLGLAREGHLDLHPNSTLVVDNKMLLVAYTGSEREQAYVHLAPGSTLRFGPNSALSRTLGNNMYLNVYMNGGTLDDRELSPEERQLIRRIYPEVPLPAAGEARIAPNPSNGEVMLLLPSSELQENWSYEVVNTYGQTIASGRLEPLAKDRYRVTPTAQMGSGLYRILVQTEQGMIVGSWVYESH